MNLPKCSLCKAPYDHGPRRPLVLPDCAHTFCGDCLAKRAAAAGGRLVCPVDEVVS